MMERELITQLWSNLHDLGEKLKLKENEIDRLLLNTQQLEEKLRAKESDLNQMRMLFSSNQTAFTEEKKQFETKVQSLMDRIDSITGEES
ncbi:MAG: hypothetical protein L6Q77_03595 [Bacteroidetes bacterium]|nr:hypothetical protein [Bacteroidota bacterium]